MMQFIVVGPHSVNPFFLAIAIHIEPFLRHIWPRIGYFRGLVYLHNEKRQPWGSYRVFCRCNELYRITLFFLHFTLHLRMFWFLEWKLKMSLFGCGYWRGSLNIEQAGKTTCSNFLPFDRVLVGRLADSHSGCVHTAHK